MRILRACVRSNKKFRKRKPSSQDERLAFASNFKKKTSNTTRPSRFDLRKQRKCTSRSSIPFKEQLIWVHMDQAAKPRLKFSLPTNQQVMRGLSVEKIQRKIRVRERTPQNAPRIRAGATKKDQKAELKKNQTRRRFPLQTPIFFLIPLGTTRQARVHLSAFLPRFDG